VDESGDTGFKPSSGRYITFGFVHCENPDLLRKVLKYQLRVMHEGNSYPSEIREFKFSLPQVKLLNKGYSREEIIDYENNGRRIVSELTNSLTNGVFASALDKQTKWYATWTPERIYNYIFQKSLGQHVLSSVTNPLVYFDKGKWDMVTEQGFRSYLKYKFDNIGVNAVYSHDEPCIWTADFVAGAFFQRLTFQNTKWFNLISESSLIGKGSHVYWP